MREISANKRTSVLCDAGIVHHTCRAINSAGQMYYCECNHPYFIILKIMRDTHCSYHEIVSMRIA